MQERLEWLESEEGVNEKMCFSKQSLLLEYLAPHHSARHTEKGNKLSPVTLLTCAFA